MRFLTAQDLTRNPADRAAVSSDTFLSSTLAGEGALSAPSALAIGTDLKAEYVHAVSVEHEMLEGRCHCGRAGWTLDGDVGTVTACNCTLCRRYGALWAYGYEGSRANLFGDTTRYTKPGVQAPALELHFCATCGGVTGYRALGLEANGQRKIAVNVRLAPPEAVLDQPIERFDGLDTFTDLDLDGRSVRDVWF